jgi:hypothetical protein
MVRTTSAVLLLAVTLVPSAPRAGDGCKPVYGFYSSQQQQDCAGLFCTAGHLIGGIQGDYAFVQTGALPAAAIGGDVASALFYVGKSDVALKSGDHVYASDSGVLDLPPSGTGKQAALLVIVGGTGAYAGATGFLQLRGTLEAGGVVSGDYLGQICTP